jgi:crotonobetainyl-CoA:carnitine CoA-transferase CaiB-like acyl-CoA transferase
VGGVLAIPFDGGVLRTAASPFALQGAGVAPDRPPPALAADKVAILADFGFGAGEIADLDAGGAFGAAAPRVAG